MKTVCTKCGSEDIGIIKEYPKSVLEPKTQTMDEMVNNMGIMTLEYRPITWICRRCGYQVSR